MMSVTKLEQASTKGREEECKPMADGRWQMADRVIKTNQEST